MKHIDETDETVLGAQGNENDENENAGNGTETVEEHLAENEGATQVLEAAAAVPPKTGRFNFDPARVASTRKGAKIRTNIYYEVIGVPGTSIKMQPQKALCLQLVNANTSDEQPRISEPDLKEIVEAAKADGTLETKQDAWRIFAYYKGQLVEEGYLAEHNVKPAPVAKAS